MNLNRNLPFQLAAAALLAALSACGGGGADTTPATPVSRLQVMGDSLADVGTFGIRFTIQGNDTYPERVAQEYGLSKGCNFFKFDGTTFVVNTTAVCSNFAIGGGVINGASGGMVAADPRIISVQLSSAVAASGGAFAATDLLLVDGGGNDASALVGAYLQITSDGGASYLGLLGSQLSSSQVSAAAAGGATGLAAAGATYMSALADTFYNQINTLALGKGAQRVALLNMPGITNTPRFQAVLNGISAAYGGGSAGAAARTQSEALFKSWVEAFNARLAEKFASEKRVAIVDFYTAFNDQIANPAQFGLSDVTTPACPVTDTGTDGLPTYSFSTCTDAALAASPPPGKSGSTWYTRYAFSDGFHPTPYGHQLVAQLISRTLARAGWL